MTDSPAPEVFEKLGAFYLGREIEGPEGDPTPTPVLYDSKDLTTHAVIVGMTGSGKTGLAVGMLEEAAIDGVPAISIDVKGDLTNLLLTFPELRTEDFRPWIDEGAASRKGKSPEEFAAGTASLWREGIAQYGQGPDRIRRLRESVDFKLYTPGAGRGVPLSLLGSLGRPTSATDDPDAQRTQILGAVSGLLTLLGIDADPIRSREHIFLSNILSWAWSEGREMSLPDLIRAVQKPPFTTVGVIDLDSFFPVKDRTGLAMALNNLLASPSFQSWREGAPLSVPDLLHGPDGKPRHSVLYIAHLSDAERMFFVTRLLNEVVAWMRTQSGTGSLRALLYMDEVFGYLPPTANPPSKQPLLTLLKQARAFGVGVVLATQNPVDLDYKALSNAGTWMLGRLQTERDKLRMLDGLEGADGGGALDRAEVDRVLSALGKRRFLLHNVHEDGPVLFHTRWVLSYLAGPLTLDRACELARSTADSEAPAPEARSETKGADKPEPIAPASAPRPMLPEGVEEVFLAPAVGERVERYVPRLLLQGRLHFVRAGWSVDHWREFHLLAPAAESDPWESATEIPETRVTDDPGDEPEFAPLESFALRKSTHRSWRTSAKAYLYRTASVELFKSPTLKEFSKPEETEGEFRMRLRHKARELRDTKVEKLRSTYEARIARLRKRVATAEERVSREESQYEQQRMSSMLDVGATVLGSFLGRKRVTRGTLSGMKRAARGFGRATKERDDIVFAKEKLAVLLRDLREMEEELEEQLDEVRLAYEPDLLELERLRLSPRKADIEIDRLAIAWIPE